MSNHERCPDQLRDEMRATGIEVTVSTAAPVVAGPPLTGHTTPEQCEACADGVHEQCIADLVDCDCTCALTGYKLGMARGRDAERQRIATKLRGIAEDRDKQRAVGDLVCNMYGPRYAGSTNGTVLALVYLIESEASSDQ